MKKNIEADLMSIAHRILQLKDKSDVNQLFTETQKLYEKLSVLRFIDKHFDGEQPTIGKQEMVALVENSFAILEEISNSNEEVILEEVPLSKKEKQEVAEVLPKKEEEKEIAIEQTTKLDEPIFVAEENKDVVNSDTEKAAQTVQISFSDLLGNDYVEPEFVKVSDIVKTTETEAKVKPARTLNDILSKSIEIDLNDRLAFVKHLFNNSNEEYNRVLSQLNTFESFFEAKSFLDDMVQPDYNNWQGKDEYVARFFEILEKKFL